METTRNDLIVTAAGSAEILHANLKRKAIFITNVSGASKTIAKGDAPATTGAGIVLPAGATWFETDSEGFTCWRGAIQLYDAGAGTIGISETVRY
jgi:hypothetical protein